MATSLMLNTKAKPNTRSLNTNRPQANTKNRTKKNWHISLAQL
jgi:hypothetical protein